MRRLPRLPRLRRLQRLPVRRLRGLRILLRVMGLVPPLLIPGRYLPTRSTNEYRDGRVRQGRPGHSMSAFRGRMPIIRAQADAVKMACRVSNLFKKC
jgi:hypothetical protein